MNAIRLIACCLFLVACSTPTPEPTPTPAPITAQSVVDMFVEAGFELSDIHTPEHEAGSPLPHSYDEWLRFTLPEVAPKGGQVFTCRSKRNCDALYAYFDALKGLAGPYTYQSAGGTVVAQMNSGLTPDTAAKFQEIVEGIP